MPGRAAPYRHRCQHSQDVFDTDRKRDSRCWICRDEIDQLLERAWDQIWPYLPFNDSGERMTDISNNLFRTIWENIEDSLMCPWTASLSGPKCGWMGNSGRHRPENLQQLLERLPNDCRKLHAHYRRHPLSEVNLSDLVPE